MKSIAQKSFEITSLFEAELLVRLMLSHWSHPLADDEGFANDLLEQASRVLSSALGGEQLIEELPPESMNLVAAVWYAENCAVDSDEHNDKILDARKNWLSGIRRALPSCFCSPGDLH